MKVAEQVEVGVDAQICLAEMDEQSNLKHGVGFEMDKFYLIPRKKATKESASQKAKPTVEKILKDNDFFSIWCGKALTHRRSPLEDCLLGENLVLNHVLKIFLHDDGGGPGVFGLLVRARIRRR